MENPWDPFPIPVSGDEDFERTLAGVGHVMSAWEAIELNFARIYSVFVGQGSRGKAIQDYGGPRIFRDRRNELQKVSDAYFVNCPDQTKESELARLLDIASRYSERRNEVAHGIVMEVQTLKYFASRMPFSPRGVPQNLVVPPFYTVRNHRDDGMPKYAFSRHQMIVLSKNMYKFNEEIVTFRKSLPGGE
jgi:hypothetical protein